MAVERIDIVVSEEILALNPAKRERLDRTQKRQPTDRVLVLAYASSLMPLMVRRVPFDQFYANPLNNLREQLLNHKWRIESIRDDTPIPAEMISVTPDLGCIRGPEFPMEWQWPANQPPKCVHMLTEPEQIDALEVPEPTGGLNGKRIEWYHAMRELAERFEVRLNGKPLKIQVTLNHPGGPIPSAFALAGENLLAWMLMEPERTQRLMQIVTDSHIRCQRHVDKLLGLPAGHSIWMGGDIGEMLSPGLFRQFVVPYYRQIWEVYGRPRTYHMCGKIDHLLEIIRDEMQIDHLDDFGFVTDRSRLAEVMGGRVQLTGGPSPILIRDGSKSEVIDACVEYIRLLGPHGAFTLAPGGDALVDTPVERFAWMVEAAERVGNGKD